MTPEKQNRTFSILFVCHGNICRSPMAEYCLKDLADKAGLSDRFLIESAATSDEEEGNPVYPPAARKLREQGIDCSAKRARRIHRGDYDCFDLIVCMDRHNLHRLHGIFDGDDKNKIVMLLSFTGHPRDIEDPWFTRDFDAAWFDIEKGCRALLSELIERLHLK